MRRADVGDDPIFRAGDLAERGQFAAMVHADLVNSGGMLLFRSQYGERQTDVVIEVALSRVDHEGLGENGRSKIFGGGLAVRSGDTEHWDVELAAPPMGESLESEEGIRNFDDRLTGRKIATFPFIYHGHRSTSYERGLGIQVTVEIFTLQCKEHPACLRLAGIGEDLANQDITRVPDEWGAEDFADLSRGGLHGLCGTVFGRKGFGFSDTGLWIRAHLRDFCGAISKGKVGFFAIIEVDGAISKLLVGLVAFSCDEDDVA